MPLQHFLTATAKTDDQEIRRAMASALVTEIPRNGAGYERFYRRVLDALEATGTNRARADVARTPAGGQLTTAA